MWVQYEVFFDSEDEEKERLAFDHTDVEDAKEKQKIFPIEADLNKNP